MDDKVAGVLAEFLGNSMIKADMHENRNWLYGFEFDAAKLLSEFYENGGRAGSFWTYQFIKLNKENILKGLLHFNFNLRQAIEDGVIE
ncbi:MAG: hypothetical protein V4629_03360 [Pseudomonadota bacterium]